MGVRITDLMDNYYDDTVLLPETDFPTAERTMELTMKKINQNRKTKRRLPKGLMIAAALIFVFSITAGAVGYSVWDAARNDLGITEELPEYTEFGNESITSNPDASGTAIITSSEEEENTEQATYHSYEIPDTPLKDQLVENAEIRVISTFCSGSNATVYFEVSPVTPDMAEKVLEENQGLDDFAFWEPACFTEFPNTEGSRYGAAQVEYNEETQSSLIRMDLYGEYLNSAEKIAVGLSWYSQTGTESEVLFYGAVEFPLTQAESMAASFELPVTNKFFDQATGMIESVEVFAGSISVTCSVTSTDELCAELGENANALICKGYLDYWDNGSEEYQYSDLSTHVYYGRSWDNTLNEILTGAYLTLDDGSIYQIVDESSAWVSANTPTSNVDNGSVVETIELSTPVALNRVVGITINDIYYDLR